MHQSSENREKQRKTYERKKKFSAAIKKDKLIWVFPCGKKEPLSLRLRKTSAVVCQRKNVLALFAIVSVKLSINLLLKEKKFKIYYDVVIFWPKLMMTIL